MSCRGCGAAFTRLGEIPVLFRDPQRYLKSCREQLRILEGSAAEVIDQLEEQLREPDLLSSTRDRGEALIDAIGRQTEDIRRILQPVLESSRISSEEPGVAASQPQTSELLTYIHYLYRDWGWPADPDGENERALQQVEFVRRDRLLGRMLVIGAGACRLAYDLHRSGAATETTVIDVDPLLFTAAHTIIRGGAVQLHEVNAEVPELGRVSKQWNLQLSQGALSDEQFHFYIANGLEPPFADESFDAVVTPWFIDVVPKDFRNLVGRIWKLLKPGGVWLNLGPLSYRPEIPVNRRYSREEVFELATMAGFHIDEWTTQSTPYLVSKLNGRGKVEWTMAFSATRVDIDQQANKPGDPPAWLLFGHIPVPAFEGLSIFASEDPAEMIVASAINGRHTVDDIAELLEAQAGATGLTRDQFREIVRRCLIDIHPRLKH